MTAAGVHGVTAVLPWQAREWALFGELLASDRLPHAVMLCGDSEIGKRQFAWALARRVLCQQPAAGRACGRCKQCLLMVKGTHPDYFPIEPAEPGKAIVVDAIRALTAFAAQTAQQGAWKVILVDPAEAMNANAANAFLKTLEEPGAKTLLLLISHWPGQVLATIRSRCRLVRFSLPPTELALPWLERVSDCADAEDLLRAADGRPLRALRFLRSELRDELASLDGLLSQVAQGEILPLVAAASCAKLPWQEAGTWFVRRVSRELRAQAANGRIPARAPFLFLDRLTTATRHVSVSPSINRQLLWEEILLEWRRLCESGGYPSGV